MTLKALYTDTVKEELGKIVEHLAITEPNDSLRRWIGILNKAKKEQILNLN